MGRHTLVQQPPYFKPVSAVLGCSPSSNGEWGIRVTGSPTFWSSSLPMILHRVILTYTSWCISVTGVAIIWKGTHGLLIITSMSNTILLSILTSPPVELPRWRWHWHGVVPMLCQHPSVSRFLCQHSHCSTGVCGELGCWGFLALLFTFWLSNSYVVYTSVCKSWKCRKVFQCTAAHWWFPLLKTRYRIAPFVHNIGSLCLKYSGPSLSTGVPGSPLSNIKICECLNQLIWDTQILWIWLDLGSVVSKDLRTGVAVRNSSCFCF